MSRISSREEARTDRSLGAGPAPPAEPSGSPPPAMRLRRFDPSGLDPPAGGAVGVPTPAMRLRRFDPSGLDPAPRRSRRGPHPAMRFADRSARVDGAAAQGRGSRARFQRGVRIAFGTDAGAFPWTVNPATEAKLMADAGMSPIAVIRALTSVAGALLDPWCKPGAKTCPKSELGVIAPGMPPTWSRSPAIRSRISPSSNACAGLMKGRPWCGRGRRALRRPWAFATQFIETCATSPRPTATPGSTAAMPPTRS